MIFGDINRIDLSTSIFGRMIEDDVLYVDKTRMIEHFITTASKVQLITRQRRIGKSLNMNMLKCFLTDKEDLRHLFKGLYIESSPVWYMANSAPVFYFDFKGLRPNMYKKVIYDRICDHIDSYCTEADMSREARRYITSDDFENTNGLLYLTESVYRATGKRSYLLIDEYDRLLMNSYNSDVYVEIREYEAELFSAGIKGNPYLEKALLTGVMRISHESFLSGLNNIKTYDVFSDSVYTDDYGLTDTEVGALAQAAGFDIAELRSWYNGIRIGGQAIYNMYSVMSYLDQSNYGCYWGRSGTMDIIARLLNDNRKDTIARLLNGEHVDVPVYERISMRELSEKATDQAFYSLLIQAGYLSICGTVEGKPSVKLVSIPNKELMLVWKEFILENLYPDTLRLRTVFDNTGNLDIFAEDLEYFLNDRLSYHDLAVHKGETKSKVHEQLYHVFLLGLLSAYEDVRFKYALSNRESGNGRYDILVEKANANYIFEVKSCLEGGNLDSDAANALAQIETRRYGVDLHNKKPLIKIGVAVYGKQCKVRCSVV